MREKKYDFSWNSFNLADHEYANILMRIPPYLKNMVQVLISSWDRSLKWTVLIRNKALQTEQPTKHARSTAIISEDYFDERSVGVGSEGTEEAEQSVQADSIESIDEVPDYRWEPVIEQPEPAPRTEVSYDEVLMGDEKFAEVIDL
jgi:hypothetical protein